MGAVAVHPSHPWGTPSHLRGVLPADSLRAGVGVQGWAMLGWGECTEVPHPASLTRW